MLTFALAGYEQCVYHAFLINANRYNLQIAASSLVAPGQTAEKAHASTL